MKHLFLLCISALLSVSIYGQKEVYEARFKEYKNKEEKITSHSKEVSDRFVYYELIKAIARSEFLSTYEFLPINFKGVKTIQIKQNGKLYLELLLNEKEQLINEKLFFQDDEVITCEYIYENGLLRKKIQKSNEVIVDETLYAYNDNEIFVKAVSKDNPPFGNYYNCNYAQLKEDFLDIYVVKFLTYNHSVIERAAVIKQGDFIIDKELNLVINLSKTKNNSPITYKYKDKEGKIVKQPTLWENIFEGEKTMYYWDTNQRITKIEFIENNETTIYTYEYKMY